MVDTLVPLQLQRTLPGLFVIGEETELDLSKGEERHGKGATTGSSRGARQHGGRRSKETGHRRQQAEHGNLPWNLVKECREREAGSAARLDRIKEPAPEEVIPTFRTPPEPGVFCRTSATVIAGCCETKQHV